MIYRIGIYGFAKREVMSFHLYFFVLISAQFQVHNAGPVEYMHTRIVGGAHCKPHSTELISVEDIICTYQTLRVETKSWDRNKQKTMASPLCLNAYLVFTDVGSSD